MTSVPPASLRVPVQSRSHRTRAVVVEAARREFETRGYADTTAKSIAERARVGTGTFYHYFPDKDSVLREIARERVQSLLDESAPLADVGSGASPALRDAAGARSRIERLVELYVGYHRTDHRLHAVITERRLCDPELAQIILASEREAVIRLSRTLGGLGHRGDTEAAAFMMFSLLEGAVHGHVLGQPMIADERFAPGLVEALFRIGAPPEFFQFPAVIRGEPT